MNCYNFGGDQLTLCEASDQQYLELKGGGGNQLILFEASDNNIWSWGWRNMQKYRPGWCALMKTGHCKLLGEPSHAHTRQMLTRVKWLQQLNLHSRAFLLSMEMDMQIQIWTCETHIYIYLYATLLASMHVALAWWWGTMRRLPAGVGRPPQ